jgi:phosphoglycolate phosphatase-like HAD superfamily hydrolase
VLDLWARDGVGDWRAALARFAEDRAPVYLRPSAEVSNALRALAADGCRLGVFTDAPEPLARVAVAQLGAERRIEALETGAGALERLIERFGPETVVVRDPGELDLQSRS